MAAASSHLATGHCKHCTAEILEEGAKTKERKHILKYHVCAFPLGFKSIAGTPYKEAQLPQ